MPVRFKRIFINDEDQSFGLPRGVSSIIIKNAGLLEDLFIRTSKDSKDDFWTLTPQQQTHPFIVINEQKFILKSTSVGTVVEIQMWG